MYNGYKKKINAALQLKIKFIFYIYRELNRNRLQQIQGLSFKNLTNLKELRLQRNKIETIDDGAFWPLKNLKLLQLDFNALRTVKKGGMFGLETLEKFTMAHNKISQIELQAWDLCKEITGLLVTHLFPINQYIFRCHM